MPPAWQISRAAFQAAKGVKQPYIAEISPFQYSRLSKRAKADYDKKRSKEWAASAACAGEYSDACFAAYQAGEIEAPPGKRWFDHPLLHRDAREQIWGRVLAAERMDFERKMKAAHGPNGDLELVAVGHTVYSLMPGCYCRVVKLLKASLEMEDSRGGHHRARRVACNWLHYNELKVAVDSDIPIGPDALALVRQVQLAEVESAMLSSGR